MLRRDADSAVLSCSYVRRMTVDEHDGAFTIHNADQPPPDGIPTAEYVVRLDIRHRSRRPVDIVTIMIDGRTAPLQEIRDVYVRNGDRRLMTERLSQDVLETVISRYNESVGNYVVTAMVVVARDH